MWHLKFWTLLASTFWTNRTETLGNIVWPLTQISKPAKTNLTNRSFTQRTVNSMWYLKFWTLLPSTFWTNRTETLGNIVWPLTQISKPTKTILTNRSFTQRTVNSMWHLKFWTLLPSTFWTNRIQPMGLCTGINKIPTLIPLTHLLIQDRSKMLVITINHH